MRTVFADSVVDPLETSIELLTFMSGWSVAPLLKAFRGFSSRVA